MTVRQPRYSKEEFARRGDEIYESQVRAALQMPQGSQVEADNFGKIVAGSSAVPKATISKPKPLRSLMIA